MRLPQILLGLLLLGAAPAAADGPLGNLEELRDQLLDDRRLVVERFLGLTEREGEAFWPVYEDYQEEVEAFRRRRMNMVLDFLERRDGFERGESISLMRDFLQLKREWVELEQAWLGEFLSVLPARKALLYYQIENKIDALVNAELAAFVPLASSGAGR